VIFCHIPFKRKENGKSCFGPVTLQHFLQCWLSGYQKMQIFMQIKKYRPILATKSTLKKLFQNNYLLSWTLEKAQNITLFFGITFWYSFFHLVYIFENCLKRLRLLKPILGNIQRWSGHWIKHKLCFEMDITKLARLLVLLRRIQLT
jgi:hypothetical protein